MTSETDFTGPWRVSALYKFVPIEDVPARVASLQAAADEAGLVGTLLVAPEGINGTVAGPPDSLEHFLAYLDQQSGLGPVPHKESWAQDKPFRRMKVRLKKEIVTLGVGDIDPANNAGTYVKPEDWNDLISQDDVVVVDTRNVYEVAIGSFEGAIDPKTKSFRDFPDWVERNHNLLQSAGKIAMFCTGGIRCEKSTAYLKTLGYEDVYHLEGGILKYLETIDKVDSHWQGDCFVFDERVGLGHGLEEAPYELCRACRRPIDAEARRHPDFEEGVSCSGCMTDYSDDDRARFRERQRQEDLAQARGNSHIGQKF